MQGIHGNISATRDKREKAISLKTTLQTKVMVGDLDHVFHE